MMGDEIRPGSLVIVIEVDSRPPRHCWGLVEKLTPSGCFIVKTGLRKENTIIATSEQLVFVTQTTGKFDSPEEAVKAHFCDILLEVTLISHTANEIRALRRYKKMVEGKMRRGFVRKIFDAVRRIPK